MALGEFVVKQEGNKRLLIIDYKGASVSPDLAAYPQVMRDVIEKLQSNEADEIVLAEYYERIYNEEQTNMLKSIADLITKMETETVWSPSHLGSSTTDKKVLSARHDAVLATVNQTYVDPFQSYLDLIKLIKDGAVSYQKVQEAGDETNQVDLKIFLGTLQFMKNLYDATPMIKKSKQYLAQIGKMPEGRAIYHSLFESAIKPSFIGSRIFFTGAETLELVDQYEVLGSKVYIYRHPEKVEYLYYINPPEYTLPPEKYFLLQKTKEVVAGHRPTNVGFMDMEQARKYFRKVYVATITDIAAQNNIELTVEEKEDLATIVSRYTIGYGILELLLSDRQLTDVYIDSPLGNKPIYLVHSKYGQCQTNIIFSEEEAKATVSRFRALSGRPFDEAHPILDFDLVDLQTRIAAIGKPLSVDGTAFALRLHKDTPWTLAQFVDFKMMPALAAGLLSYFVDAQASMLIVGSRGAGKTSMLQAMMQEIPQNLRIIVQEDTQELPIPQLKQLGFNIQRLKTRPPLGSQGDAEVSAEDALRTALRLGDSVLIVGEVRSGEARALYEAMRVGAVGNVVMGTIHGESAYSIWDRVVNDLGVPTTSFKATDMVVVAAPIRFKGSLKRQRRLIEITEVKKDWTEDPGKENGFLNWMMFDANKDNMDLFRDDIKNSEWIKKVMRNRGIGYDEIWNEIVTRAASKQYLVDVKNKHGIPKILEAENSIRAHGKLMLLAEKQRDEFGKVDHSELVKDWQQWVDNVLAKEVIGLKSLG
ncbi:MAG: type II/IV secretion system ATPase subunit [Candidatus Micrarchaeota archaeon]|nr:type II/IV secretion system ATPase subunit [Candidatus Micrarchaeota archaeon]